ncbi:rfbP protein [Vibrio sp. A11]|nr:rfbP protein [Vibrio sp. A11]
MSGGELSSLPVLVVIPKPPPWAVVIEPWGYCPKKCPC